jgi:hypothetical protein
MATMVEFEQRMLTKRPTVARTSERGVWLTPNNPTRATDPRTEITRPKDVTLKPVQGLKSTVHYAKRDWKNG